MVSILRMSLEGPLRATLPYLRYPLRQYRDGLICALRIIGIEHFVEIVETRPLMPDTAIAAVAITLTFLLAGVVKGVIGMGLPTVAMGLLSLVMPPVQAAALLLVPSLVTNVWQLCAGPRFAALLARFSTLMLAIVFGTFAGTGLLTGSTGAIANIALGTVLALYGVVGLCATRLVIPAKYEPVLSPVVGLLTGVLTGATGIFVIPAVPYFNSLGLEKEELIQTLGLSFTVSTVALAAGLLVAGKFELAVAGSSVAALLPALGGMFLGRRLRGRIKPQVFRRWFFIGLVILGGYMVMRAVSHSP
jgi:uncharacterized membrane protein YfcA